MRNLKLSFFILFSIIIENNSFSQENHFCGQTKYYETKYKNNPELKAKHIEEAKKLEEFTSNFIKNKQEKNTEKNIGNLTIGHDYIIPVVVHVIHNNGYENLSDKAIERAIEMLNSFYGGTSAWDKFETQTHLNIRGGFNGNGKKLKFVLAKFDPNGNPTNGIDRKLDSYHTLRGDINAMRLNYNWPRKNYFNIYIVKQAVQNDGRSGFATFPFEVNTAQTAYLDGHVMSAWSFGEHENTYQTWYNNLSHEVGHWLNVYHIWDQMGQNGDPANCSTGTDLVADTPTTTGNQLADIHDIPEVGSIDTCPTKSGLDNYTNMMDYTAAVYAMFTQGQKSRMSACLESNTAERNNLWSTANVLAKLYGCTIGTDTDGDKIPDSCDPCPNSPNNDSDLDGICDSNDLCNGFPDVNLDANPSSPDSCDPLIPIINFNTNPYIAYDPSLDNGVGFTYDNGATLYTSINAWKAVSKNYNITPNTVIEFDFKSTVKGEAHYIGIDNNLIGNPLLRFKIFGTNTDVNGATVNVNYNNYSNADLYTYKHYNIPIGTFYTGNISHLIFAAQNNSSINGTWNNSNTFLGNGSYNDATSFFRNVKIYEKTILSTEDQTIENQANIFSNNNAVVVEAINNIEKIEIFNLLGQNIYNTENLKSNSFVSDFISEKMVIVKIQLSNGHKLTKKLIIN